MKFGKEFAKLHVEFIIVHFFKLMWNKNSALVGFKVCTLQIRK